MPHHKHRAFDGAPIKEYEEKDLSDKVKLYLPDNWKCRVFKITSAASGEIYWIQILTATKNGDSNEWHNQTVALCDCPVGKFIQPIEVIGLAKDIRCKHVLHLLELLKQEEK